MAPSKDLCKVLSSSLLAYAKLVNKIIDIREFMGKSIGAKAKILFGSFNISDTILSEVLSTIPSVASYVAKSILESVSKASANVFEAILGEILKIILSFPSAIFSLVAIPHSVALESAKAERIHLIRANLHLRNILRFISKWLQVPSGISYYEQIKRAIPFVEKALRITLDMIVDLNEGGGRLAQFDRNKYKSMQNNLDKAIEITMPKSIIENRLGISKAIDNEKVKIYREKASIINKEYRDKRSAINTWFYNESSKVKLDAYDINSAMKIEKLNGEYSFRKDLIESLRKNKLAAAETQANIQAVINSSAYIKSIGGIAAEFSYDVQMVGKSAKEFLENMRDAYVNYKRCQASCNSIYNIRSLITNLINEIIDIMQDKMTSSSKVASGILNQSASMIEVALDKLNDSANKYEVSDGSISSTELASSIIVSNSLLIAADTLVESSITKSLMDLINADDVLIAENEEFDDFILRLESIVDWDGNKVTWVADPYSNMLTPYIQVISDATSLVTKILTLSTTVDNKDRTAIKNMIIRSGKNYKSLISHNLKVTSVLESYTPYSPQSYINLKRLLSNAGLLNTFAITLSVKSMVNSIVAMFSTNPLSRDNIPTYKNCMKHYPDMFESFDIAMASVMARNNVPAAELSINFQNSVEKNAEGIAQTREYSSSMSLHSNVDDKDLLV
jgi:hypothetical protein